MIEKAIKGNHYYTRRLSHLGRRVGDQPIIKVFAKTGGKEFPVCEEVVVNEDGSERLFGIAHPVATSALFETEQEAIEYEALQRELSAKRS